MPPRLRGKPKVADREAANVGPDAPTQGESPGGASSSTLSAETPAEPAATTASMAGRRAPKRLESLNTPASASSTPQSTRGRGSRGRKPKPVNTTRRSKVEREAMEQELIEKERIRKQEELAEERRNNRGRGRGRGRGGQNRGRGGGVMGTIDQGASGLFSTGRYEKQSNRSGPSGFGGGRATVVKSEPNDISWGGGSGSGHAAGTFGGRAGVKAEQPEELHSDDDLAELPAQDIDNIAYESEEEDDGMGAEEKVNLARNRSQPIHLPVRIHRKQHQDRVVGINTESSTAPAGKVVQTGEPSSSAGSGADGASARKGKKKGKEVEITEVRRPYKGMWQDEEEDEVMVKPEPIDEDGDSLFLPEARPLPATVPRNKGKAKAQKAKRPAAPAAPVLQTEEEKREWERHQAALRALKAELGTKAEPISTEIRDENGDIVMKEGEEGEASTDVPKRSIRDDQVYIFQLPPIMPELVAPAPKPEATDDDSTANDNKNPDSTPIKVEDDPTASNPANKTSLPSGRVGKMRVHESGKVTLEWGGLNFIVNKGIDVSFLQEVVSTKVTPPEERVNEDDGGEAMSFGSVRGKFVVTPDWDDLLG